MKGKFVKKVPKLYYKKNYIIKNKKKNRKI